MPSFVPDNFPLDGISGMTLPGLDGSSRSRDYARGRAVHDIDAPKVGFPCNLPIPAKLNAEYQIDQNKKNEGYRHQSSETHRRDESITQISVINR